MRYLQDRIAEWDRELTYHQQLPEKDRGYWSPPSPEVRDRDLKALKQLATEFSVFLDSQPDAARRLAGFNLRTWNSMRKLIES